jgi:uncharacterized membrane protein
MTLAPLLEAPLVIRVHAFAPMAAFAVGLVQFAAPKGTLPHRAVGWSWTALMLTVAVSSLFIHLLRIWGPWSPIHLLSLLVLVTLPLAVWATHRQEVRHHRRAMTLHRGARDRRRLHLAARPHHARGRVRAVRLSPVLQPVRHAAGGLCHLIRGAGEG